MGLTVENLQLWDLGTVSAMSTSLRTDAADYQRLAAEVHEEGDRLLLGMNGASADEARTSIASIVATIRRTADTATRAADVLSTFVADVSPVVTRALERAATPGTDPIGDPEIVADLHVVEDIDLRTANALRELSGERGFDYYPNPDFRDNHGKTSTVAGGAISAKTDLLGAVAGRYGVGTSAKIIAGAFPGFGTALGFGIGVKDAPEGEPMTETLLAEGAGALFGLAAGTVVGDLAGLAATGAGPVGVAAASLAGTGAGSLAGYQTSVVLRDHFDHQRGAGHDPFDGTDFLSHANRWFK